MTAIVDSVYLSCRFAVHEVDAVFTLSEQDLLVLLKIKPPVLDPLTHCGLSHFLCKDLRSMQIQLLKGPGVATRRTGHDQNFLEERERFDCILCCAQRVGCRYLCQKLLQVPRMGLDVREIRRAFRDNKQLAFRLLHQDWYSYLLSPKAVSGIRPVGRGGVAPQRMACLS